MNTSIVEIARLPDSECMWIKMERILEKIACAPKELCSIRSICWVGGVGLVIICFPNCGLDRDGILKSALPEKKIFASIVESRVI